MFFQGISLSLLVDAGRRCLHHFFNIKSKLINEFDNTQKFDYLTPHLVARDWLTSFSFIIKRELKLQNSILLLKTYGSLMRSGGTEVEKLA